MSDIAIQVENLGKKYQLGRSTSDGARYQTLRETLTRGVQRAFRRGASRQTKEEEFWALRDLNFEINQGEVVGIIGRNGAGKSTLLKILSRITEPTTGRISIHGRVASLLEVGTGFHPELTGRENIYLNGAILGMSRAEIRSRFDEIVQFAEVEKFLGTPVKRYSSGMYVRLAFAVAAHMDPEILIIDEVLAVGDSQFQKKCLGKMHEISDQQGRTVLFVSHNLGVVNQLCGKAILLEQGTVKAIGKTRQVTTQYMDVDSGKSTEVHWTDPSSAPGNATVRLGSVRIITCDAEPTNESIDVRDGFGVEVVYNVLQDGAILTPSLHVHNSEGIQLFLAIDLEKEWANSPRPRGTYRSIAWIPGNFLNIGMHFVSIACSRLDTNLLHFFERDIIGFNVCESGELNTARGAFSGSLPGIIRPILEWETTAATFA